MTRILIVDNNPDNRLVLNAILRRHFPHGEILEADGGEQGIRMAREHEPDLVLLDYRMPGLDGPDTCSILKKDPATHRIPILMITSERTGTEYRIIALKAGADAFVIRPVEEAALVAQVKAMLRLKAAEEARLQYQQKLEQMVAEKTYELNLRNEIARICVVTTGTALYGRVASYLLHPFESASGLFGYVQEGSLTWVFTADEGGSDTVSSCPVDQVRCAELKRVLNGEPVLSNNPVALPLDHVKAHRMIAAPVTYRGEVIGLLALINRYTAYTDQDLRLLEGVADYLAPMVQARLAQEQANAQRDLLIAIVEQAAEGILFTDMDGTIRYANPALCRMTGYQADELVGRNPRIFKSGKQNRSFYQHLYRELGEGRPVNCTMINRRKDGSEYEEEATIFPVRNATDDIVAYAGIKRDMTRLRELEHQLQQSQKLEAVGRLTGGIAHDFNNLLTTILGYTEMALGRIDPDTPVHRQVSHVHSAARRAADLTAKLLTFSRRQAITPRLIDLASHLRQMHSLLQPLAGERITLELDLGDAAIPVLADTAQVEQIILNLVVNAADALHTLPGHPDPRIWIALSRIEQAPEAAMGMAAPSPTGYAVLTVADNGPGIPEEIRDRIFDPFFTTKDAGHGTGLGLSTVFGIVRQNRAGIRVRETDGGGATFRVFWPLAESTVDELADHSAPSKPPCGDETVLLVEDESAVREVTAGMLQALGYTVRTAENGRDALSVLASQPSVDMVITDVAMPVMDGPSLARELAKQAPRLPILFMSGHTDDRLLGDYLSDTFSNLIRKPFTIHTLATAVRETLSKKDGGTSPH